MTKRPDKHEDPVLQCEVCLKQIPRSVAKSHEGAGYVHYFCGADCYALWQTNGKKPVRG